MAYNEDLDRVGLSHSYLSLFTPFQPVCIDDMLLAASLCGKQEVFESEKGHKEMLLTPLQKHGGVRLRDFATRGISASTGKPKTIYMYVLEEQMAHALGKVDVLYGNDSNHARQLVERAYVAVVQGSREIPRCFQGATPNATMRNGLVAKHLFRLAVGYDDTDNRSRIALAHDCLDGRLHDPADHLLEFAARLHKGSMERMVTTIDPEYFGRVFPLLRWNKAHPKVKKAGISA